MSHALRILGAISTPWTPYSVVFAHDGSRLGIGGGAWYGFGGVLLVSLATHEQTLYPGGEPLKETVSGLCFSSDDRHLVASTWSSSHHYGPVLVLRACGSNVESVGKLDFHYGDPIGHPCPTGVLLHGGYAITRNHTAWLDDVIGALELPANLEVATGPVAHRFRHSGLVVLDRQVITGGGGSGTSQWRRDLGFGETGKAADGLVVATLGPVEPKVNVVPVRDCRRVTAIARLGSSGDFITGGLDGELDSWSPHGWVQHRLSGRTVRPYVRDPRVVWAAYTPDSIIGICGLRDGKSWVSVSAGGELRLFKEQGLLGSWDLPVAGSPRSVAAHPEQPWIAVGIKQGGFGEAKSTVVLVDMEAS
jgi:hypothetical protein